MKKLITLLLALTMILSLAACGGKAPTAGNPQGTGSPAASTETKPPIDSATVQGTEKPVENSTKLAEPPTAEQMLTDVRAYNYPLFVENGIQITSLELLRRQSNPEQKEDIAVCKLIEESGPMRWEYQFKLRYDYFDQGGWNLEEMIPDREDLWTPIYRDAEGNNLMDSIIWLSGNWSTNEDDWSSYYTPYYLEIGSFLGIHNNTAWIKYNNYGIDNREVNCVYDQNGNVLWSVDTDELELIFVSPSGDVRLITRERIKKPETSIISYGNYQLWASQNRPVGDSYDSISYLEMIDLYLVKKGNLYGLMDQNGVLVEPVTFEKVRDIPEYAPYATLYDSRAKYEKIDRPDSIVDKSIDRLFNGVYTIQTILQRLNDSYPIESFEVVDTNGTSILNVPYENTILVDNAVLAFSNDKATEGLSGGHWFDGQFYNLAGRALTPRLQMAKQSMRNGDSHSLGPIFVLMDGKIGILPSLLSTEERYYFHYVWGWEHYNAKN